ncbi:hypothetical protein ASF30_02600 [Leifsonia sp. Leaf264]|nr:hypothetical protein ASF30_02600 [Leifsonia sp. Leaf264]
MTAVSSTVSGSAVGGASAAAADSGSSVTASLPVTGWRGSAVAVSRTTSAAATVGAGFAAAGGALGARTWRVRAGAVAFGIGVTLSPVSLAADSDAAADAAAAFAAARAGVLVDRAGLGALAAALGEAEAAGVFAEVFAVEDFVVVRRAVVDFAVLGLAAALGVVDGVAVDASAESVESVEVAAAAGFRGAAGFLGAACFLAVAGRALVEPDRVDGADPVDEATLSGALGADSVSVVGAAGAGLADGLRAVGLRAAGLRAAGLRAAGSGCSSEDADVAAFASGAASGVVEATGDVPRERAGLTGFAVVEALAFAASSAVAPWSCGSGNRCAELTQQTYQLPCDSRTTDDAAPCESAQHVVTIRARRPPCLAPGRPGTIW